MLLAGFLIKEQLVLRPVARFLRKVQLVAKTCWSYTFRVACFLRKMQLIQKTDRIAHILRKVQLASKPAIPKKREMNTINSSCREKAK
jgi:hypothetical protein